MPAGFFEIFNRINPDPRLYLNDYISAWKDFVEQCSEGYQMNYFEYSNDLSLRDHIQIIINTETLKDYPEYFSFISAIEAIDKDFKTACIRTKENTNNNAWWENLIPSKNYDLWVIEGKLGYSIYD